MLKVQNFAHGRDVFVLKQTPVHFDGLRLCLLFEEFMRNEGVADDCGIHDSETVSTIRGVEIVTKLFHHVGVS